MRKNKGFLSVLLCLSLLLGLSSLTALASEYREPLTLVVFDELANYAGEQAGWFAKEIEDRFNLKLNIISTNLDPTQWQTRMSAGELGDLVIFGDTGCRIDREKLQDCNDPAAWPFPKITAAAAKTRRRIDGGFVDHYGFAQAFQRQHRA